MGENMSIESREPLRHVQANSILPKFPGSSPRAVISVFRGFIKQVQSVILTSDEYPR